MRIVTWNCSGALRRKLRFVDALEADVLVIQECENPAATNEEYQSWAGDYLWTGYGKNKGIGVFPRRGQSLERLAWPDDGLRLFLPVRIDDEIDILAVWTQQAVPSSMSYIGQLWRYLQLHQSKLASNSVICGDFNSNQIWDKPGRPNNHSECVNMLERDGFRSVYHLTTEESQGQEIKPTFYLHRHASKPYHIDYVFVRQDSLSSDDPRVSVGEPSDWLALSDHMPITVDI